MAELRIDEPDAAIARARAELACMGIYDEHLDRVRDAPLWMIEAMQGRTAGYNRGFCLAVPKLGVVPPVEAYHIGVNVRLLPVVANGREVGRACQMHSTHLDFLKRWEDRIMLIGTLYGREFTAPMRPR